MSKVTEEKAFKAISNLIDTDPFVFAQAVIDLTKYVGQHKPPTFEEVVKAWEDRYDTIKNDLVFEEKQGELLIKAGNIWMANVAIGGGYTEYHSSINNISNKRINLINLTIKYLESKETDSEG